MLLTWKPSPVLLASFAQFFGAGAGYLVWWYAVTLKGTPLEEIWLPVVASSIVASLSGKYFLKLPNWWLPINAVFIPAVVGALSLNLPGWAYLLAFVLTLAIFWNVRSERVPLYLTNPTTCHTLSKMLPDRPGARFMDLGSGLSGTIHFLARQHPDMQFSGVESAPIPFILSKIRQRVSGQSNLEVSHRNMWAVDLSEFDIVYCFLSPAPMTRLFEKARSEMKPGSILISNSFEVENHPPHERHHVMDPRQTQILIWRF